VITAEDAEVAETFAFLGVLRVLCG